MFWRKKLTSGASKLDKIVTWIIIGSAVASIFWLSQTKKGKQITSDVKEKGKQITSDVKDRVQPSINSTSKKVVRVFGKLIAFFVSIFSKKK